MLVQQDSAAVTTSWKWRVPDGYVLLRVPESHTAGGRVRQMIGTRGVLLRGSPRGGSLIADVYGVVVAPAEMEAELRALRCTRPRGDVRLALWMGESAEISRARAIEVGALYEVTREPRAE